MNKLVLSGRVWIASDIHLGPDLPATTAAFHAFLERAAEEADALILAGDLFDAWIGDDVALMDPEPWLATAVTTLQQVAARLPLWLGRGNRDFLLGRDFARHVGARLITESALLETDAGLILLAHGDEYCTADHSYQRFRRIVRHGGVQAAYLALPLPLRKRIAAWARGRSTHSNQYKAPEIMDVNDVAVAQALRASGATVLIHGHTHRPARHALNVDGRAVERIVLPDWEFDHTDPPRGGWAAIDTTGVHLVEYGAPGFTRRSTDPDNYDRRAPISVLGEPTD